MIQQRGQGIPSQGSQVAEAIVLLRAALPKATRIELEPQPNLPRIEADPVAIQQIVINLCLNAAQAIVDGRGVIRIRLETTLLAESEFVCLSVIDLGRGMGEVTRAHVLDPAAGIRGLDERSGLAMVHELVKAHGGRISLRSAPGVGTDFSIYFPGLRSQD